MTTPATDTMTNPYVGPRTFDYADRKRYFGREREARSLLARMVSERLLLFYAQSGAGKSSLLNTRLIPHLREEEGFSVLPVGRVSGQLPAGLEQVDNIFLFNLMSSLDHTEGAQSGSGGSTARLAHLSLGEFLEHLVTDDGLQWRYDPGTAVTAEEAAPADDGGPAPRFALVIDQFEEIITGHPDRWQEREAFFRQLDAALLANPNLWVVLSLREDYVASLDPYAPLVFNRLRARFYMERMGVDAALDAIRKPAELGGRPFAAGVAEKLADDLRQMRVPGQNAAVLGQYVEPVQLQVVCFQLWENIKGRVAGPITAADLQEAGDVNRALTQFYDETLAAALVDPGTPVTGRQLRTWFDKELITEAGTRGLVRQGEETTGSLPNAIVGRLQKRFLVRAEARSGDTWIELVHDRFVEPIRQSNRAWFEAHLSPFQRQAALWQQQDRPDSLLLAGDALAEAERWADAHAAELEPHERDFLAAGRKTREDLAERLALTAQVLLKQQRDLALLLAAEANRDAVTPSSRNSLLRSLQDDLHLGLLPLPQVSQGHSGAINCIAVSPDGKLFATGGTDKKVLLWNLAERKPIGEPLLGHSGDILILAFSPDGRILASAGQDTTIRLWDVATHRPAGPSLYGHYEPVWGLAFSPDGRLLASSDEAGNIVIWDLWAWLPSEERTAPTALPSGRTVDYLEGHPQAVWWLAFRPQGDLLASASFDGTVGLWDVQTGRQVAKLEGHTSKVLCAAFSKDGERLASSDWSGSVFVWDVAKRQRSLELKGHSAPVATVEFSPDELLLVSGGWDGQVIVWDAATGNTVHPPLSGHKEKISGVAFTPDGQELVSADLARTVLVWNVATGAQVSPPLVENKVSANSVAVTPDGSTLIGGCSDGSLVLWDLPAGQIQGAPLRGHRRGVSWVRVSPDGRRMVSADWDGTLVIWDTAERRPVTTLRKRREDSVYGAAFSPDGQTLASCGRDGRVLVWHCDDGTLVKEMQVEGGSALMVAYQPGGSLLASAHADGIVRLWDPASRQLVAGLEGHRDVVYILAWHPAGRLLASGGRDGRVWLWDAKTRCTVREPLFMKEAYTALEEAGHSADSVKHVYPDWARQWGSNHTVSSLAFSPDGEFLASGAVSGAIALWDVESGRLLGLPLWSGSPIALDLAFTPDGSQLISAHSDGTIHRWATGDETWRSLARRLAGRDLTPEERQVYLK